MAHPEFDPVLDPVSLLTFDSEELHIGFMAGYGGLPEPVASDISASIWQGWRIGRVRGGHDKPDDAAKLFFFLSQTPFWVQ